MIPKKRKKKKIEDEYPIPEEIEQDVFDIQEYLSRVAIKKGLWENEFKQHFFNCW